MHVDLIDHMGTDMSIINAMLVSTGKDGKARTEPNNADIRRLNFLVKNKHASPFEHCVVTFRVECPLTVRSEWQRHRTLSYNEFSYRYSVPDELHAYLPEIEDMRKQVGKPGAYTTAPLSVVDAVHVQQMMQDIYLTTYNEYTRLIELGVAPEVARGVLPMNTMTKFYVTGNLRNWFNFLVLRTSEQAMLEIRRLALEVEALIKQLFPAAWTAWDGNGRPQL